MTNYRPLFYSLGIIFLFAIIINLVATPYIDTSQVDESSFLYTSGIYEHIQNSIDGDFLNFIDLDFDLGGSILADIPLIGGLFDFALTIPIPTINLLSLLPSGALTFINTQLVLFSYIPDIILIPVSILIILGIIWGVVKLILA